VILPNDWHTGGLAIKELLKTKNYLKILKDKARSQTGYKIVTNL
jgi:hypothetical protein